MYTRRFKVANGPSTVKCMTRLQYIHITEYYTATGMNHPQMYTTIWMNLTNILTIRGKKLDTEVSIRYDSTFIEFKINLCPEAWVIITLGWA